MKHNVAIKVEGLSKRYRIGQYVGGGAQYKTLRESLTNAVKSPFRALSSRVLSSRALIPRTQPPRPNTQDPTPNNIWAL